MLRHARAISCNVVLPSLSFDYPRDTQQHHTVVKTSVRSHTSTNVHGCIHINCGTCVVPERSRLVSVWMNFPMYTHDLFVTRCKFCRDRSVRRVMARSASVRPESSTPTQSVRVCMHVHQRMQIYIMCIELYARTHVVRYRRTRVRSRLELRLITAITWIIRT